MTPVNLVATARNDVGIRSQGRPRALPRLPHDRTSTACGVKGVGDGGFGVWRGLSGWRFLQRQKNWLWLHSGARDWVLCECQELLWARWHLFLKKHGAIIRLPPDIPPYPLIQSNTTPHYYDAEMINMVYPTPYTTILQQNIVQEKYGQNRFNPPSI